ncbi:alanine/glycine:cation symporter family protein [Paracoccus salsus]|uniref:alanine/glycine:cation symporter family protein n=1 Tax=Paracoccus salsus TaxID=2911061 RepID=UPI001F33F95E|nr:alanine/glycine:cation symporter family protein [Paracoccus salsus]MCF3973735.1 alanine:cation symporter family protein [Paracoccus salsus]
MKIKAFLTAFLAVMTAWPAAAQSIAERIDSGFAAATSPFVNFIFANFPGTNFSWIVVWLVVGASVFTVYFGFIQFRAFGHSLALVSGKYSDPNDAGEVSHFQALATALSGTVGLGNIAGVAVAVSIGGAGATFWMILAGLLGMASKFTECTLAVKYRNEYEDGTVSGGPMYYMTKGFAERGLPLGGFMAIVFSIFCVLGSLGGGNMFQANQAAAQLRDTIGLPVWVTGLTLSIIVFVVIVGGIKSIARVTEKVVPFMGVGYVLISLLILIMNADMIGWAFGEIFRGAFTDTGIVGGLLGALIQGFRRAAFSNEAGVGSAAIAHSAVRTKEPITEGFVSLLEPFIDTVVICTMTALVIIITQQLTVDPVTGLYAITEEGRIAIASGATGGVPITSGAFGSVFSWAPYALSVAVVLFAFSTMISWSYYGLKAWTYMFGEGKTKEMAFKIMFCVFVFIGSVASLGAVIDFSDAAIFAMAVVNITALYLLMPIVKRELNSYLSRLKSGEIRKFE